MYIPKGNDGWYVTDSKWSKVILNPATAIFSRSNNPKGQSTFKRHETRPSSQKTDCKSFPIKNMLQQIHLSMLYMCLWTFASWASAAFTWRKVIQQFLQITQIIQIKWQFERFGNHTCCSLLNAKLSVLNCRARKETVFFNVVIPALACYYSILWMLWMRAIREAPQKISISCSVISPVFAGNK